MPKSSGISLVMTAAHNESEKRRLEADLQSVFGAFSDRSSNSTNNSQNSADESDIDSRTFSDIDTQEAIRLGNLQNNEKHHPGYIGTANSFTINESIRRAVWDDPNGDPLRNLSSANRQVVERLDNAMRPIGRDINVTRFVDWKPGSWSNFDGFKDTLDKIGFDGTSASIEGAVLRFPSFTSTSWNVRQNVFTGRDTQLHIRVPKEARGMIDSRRTAESEIIFARDTHYRIDRYVKNGRTHHIYLTILP